MDQDPLALDEAISDLTIGLIGIPIAISLGDLYETVFKDSDWVGLLYSIVVLFVFITISIILFTSFSLAKREADHPENADIRHPVWEHKLIIIVAFLGLPAVFTGLLTAGIGACFKPNECPDFSEIIEGSPASQTLMFFCFLGLILLTLVYLAINNHRTVRKAYPVLTPYTFNLFISTFTIVLIFFFRTVIVR